MRHSLSTLALALGLASLSSAAVDTGLLVYVPADSRLVSAVDLVRTRASAFGLHMLSRIDAEDDNFARFGRETGFDPRYDLQDFLFAGGQPNRFAILARGNFDHRRIVAAAKAKGATVEQVSGMDLVIDHHKDEETGFAFLERDIVVMADTATLKSIVANRANATTLNPTLALHISTFGATHDAWFVSVDRAISIPKHLDFDLDDGNGKAKALNSITTASGGILFGNTVALTFKAITRTAQDATSLADLVRLISSAVQLGRQSDPHAAIVASAVDHMDLGADGTNFHLGLTLPEQDVERLADMQQHARASKRSTP